MTVRNFDLEQANKTTIQAAFDDWAAGCGGRSRSSLAVAAEYVRSSAARTRRLLGAFDEDQL